jgi:hypothetical protein
MPKDKLQREIDELLDNLDTFVPEERFAQKIKDRNRRERQQERALRRAESGPSPWDRVTRAFSQITLGQIMIAGLVLMIFTWLPFGDLLGEWKGEVGLLGLLLTVVAFVLSIVNRGGPRTTVGGRRIEKRWRGQVIEYSEPSPTAKARGWFRRRGR